MNRTRVEPGGFRPKDASWEGRHRGAFDPDHIPSPQQAVEWSGGQFGPDLATLVRLPQPSPTEAGAHFLRWSRIYGRALCRRSNLVWICPLPPTSGALT